MSVTRLSLTVRYVRSRSSACAALPQCTREVYGSHDGGRTVYPGVYRGCIPTMVYREAYPSRVVGRHIHQVIYTQGG